MIINGFQIIPHPLARDVLDVWRVEKNPVLKRRRNWRVVKHRIDRPGAYRIGSVIYMHPDLVKELQRTIERTLSG